MIVSSLWLQNFMSHKNTTFSLPKKGVVLVTGPNGAGKSSIMEAVAMGVWGKTLRGASPWVTGRDGCVSISFEENTVMRTRKGPKTALQWTNANTKYETTRKAQEALDQLVGRFEIWRRCAVFSSHDAAHFTLASDGERKRLLENILGLGKFDDALAKCRVDLKICASKLLRLKNELSLAYNSLQYEKQNLEESHSALKSLAGTVIELTEEDVSTDKQTLKSISADISQMESELTERIQELAELKANTKTANSKLAIVEQEACYTCGQKIAKKLKDRICVEAENAKKALEDKHQEIDISTIGVKEDLLEIKEYYADLYKKIQKNESDKDSRKWLVAEKVKLASKISSVGESAKFIEEKIANIEQEIVALFRQESILAASEKVLGLRGVRAHVLGTALDGLEMIANDWLSKIAGNGVQLTISPYKENKTGGVSDSIAISISGVGGGNGYKGASGGQRRRVDVALLLALAELAQAAQGTAPGTVFFDEVFDSLDAEGIEAVSAVLSEMGDTRPVVVISHSDKLAATLKCTQHIQINGGDVA